MPLADQADRAVRATSSPESLRLAALIAAAVAEGEQPDADLINQYRAATAPPAPKGRTPLRNFRMDDDRWEQVTTAAAAEGMTASEFIRAAIETAVEGTAS